MSNNLLEQINEATEKKLKGDFITELIKCCFINQKIFDICRQHLKYHFLANEAQKKVVKYIYEHFDVHNVIPTPGVVSQLFPLDKEVTSLLATLKKTEVGADKFDTILSTFEQFIRKSRFLALYNKVTELYNQGKQEEAMTVQAKESEEIVNFELKDNFYTTVFKDFDKRNTQRQSSDDKTLLEKLTTGIHGLDDITRGGLIKGTSSLCLARSGVGKSTYLRWLALCNARQGKRVVYFSAEGTEKELLAAFDAGWSGVAIDEMELGTLPATKQTKIKKAHTDILGRGGEIYTFCSEQFTALTIEVCRDVIMDIEKLHGKVDLVCWDYLELFSLKGSYSNTENAERKRREDLANRITAISVELKLHCAVATQASDVEPDKLKKPDFVLTRHNTAECKGLVRPFSYHFTLNATPDEYESQILRIYVDKLRKGHSGQTVRIYQSRNNARFYDSVKTTEAFYEKAS